MIYLFQCAAGAVMAIFAVQLAQYFFGSFDLINAALSTALH